jgi:hypothetical protein
LSCTATDIVFAEERSLRGLAFNVAKVWSNYHMKYVAERVGIRLSDLVTIVATPHIYGKVVLVVTFGSSLCIVTII